MRWIRIDPADEAGLRVTVREGPLACGPDLLDVVDYRELDETPVFSTVLVRTERDVPPVIGTGRALDTKFEERTIAG